MTRNTLFKKIKKRENTNSKILFQKLSKIHKKNCIKFLTQNRKKPDKNNLFFHKFFSNFLIFLLKNQRFWIPTSLYQIFFVKKNQKLANKNSKLALKMRTFFLFFFRKTQKKSK